jgi:hypothetical protein
MKNTLRKGKSVGAKKVSLLPLTKKPPSSRLEMLQDISLALTNENAVNLNILQVYLKMSNLIKFASFLIAFYDLSLYFIFLIL